MIYAASALLAVFYLGVLGLAGWALLAAAQRVVEFHRAGVARLRRHRPR